MPGYRSPNPRARRRKLERLNGGRVLSPKRAVPLCSPSDAEGPLIIPADAQVQPATTTPPTAIEPQPSPALLDHNWFPHIFDLILSYAPPESRLVLRQTCRELYDSIPEPLIHVQLGVSGTRGWITMRLGIFVNNSLVLGLEPLTLDEWAPFLLYEKDFSGVRWSTRLVEVQILDLAHPSLDYATALTPHAAIRVRPQHDEVLTLKTHTLIAMCRSKSFFRLRLNGEIDKLVIPHTSAVRLHMRDELPSQIVIHVLGGDVEDTLVGLVSEIAGHVRAFFDNPTRVEVVCPDHCFERPAPHSSLMPTSYVEELGRAWFRAVAKQFTYGNERYLAYRSAVELSIMFFTREEYATQEGITVEDLWIERGERFFPS